MPTTIYVDGGCHNNGTPQARMYGSYKIGGQHVVRLDLPPNGRHTNNRAEYLALITCLEEARLQGLESILVLAGSQLLVNQVNGDWKIKDLRFAFLKVKIDSLRAEFKEFALQWVDRGQIFRVLGH